MAKQKGVSFEYVKNIPLADVIGCMCAWEGCQAGFVGDITRLPPGWRLLVVAADALFERRNLLTADQDSVLCPMHAAELNALLKHMPQR